MSTCGLCLGILAQQPLVLYFCWCWRCPCIAVVLVLALHMCWHCTCIVFVIVPVLVLLLCIIVTNCLSFFDHFSAFDNWKRNDGRFVRAAAFHWYFISCLLLRCHADHNINIYPSLSLSLSWQCLTCFDLHEKSYFWWEQVFRKLLFFPLLESFTQNSCPKNQLKLSRKYLRTNKGERCLEQMS